MHLEAGLRSRDRGMPEEINRIATDAIVDVLWTPSPDADDNLLAEGVPPDRIDRVGNIMLDTFEMMRPRDRAPRACAKSSACNAGGFRVVTLHRPSNVDDRATLAALVQRCSRSARSCRWCSRSTRARASGSRSSGCEPASQSAAGVRLIEPSATSSS